MCVSCHSLMYRLVINYREGELQNGKIAGSIPFAPPPPPKTVHALLLKDGNLLCPSFSIWLKLKAPGLKLPQNLLCPPPPS